MKKISFLATLIVGLLFSTLSYGANDIQPTDLNSNEITTLDISGSFVQDLETSEPSSQNAEIEVYEVGECCGTCTVSINLVFFSFEYEWCCNKCKEEQQQ